MTAQVIQPSGRLRARLGPRFTGVDPDLIARAEAALQELSGQFDGWLEDEVARLEAAREGITAGGDGAAWRELQRRAHDLKGLGGTYGYPLVTRVCASLCLLLGDKPAQTPGRSTLIDAHVEAVRALVRGGVRGADDRTGLALCEALEARVAACLRGNDPPR